MLREFNIYILLAVAAAAVIFWYVRLVKAYAARMENKYPGQAKKIQLPQWYKITVVLGCVAVLGAGWMIFSGGSGNIVFGNLIIEAFPVFLLFGSLYVVRKSERQNNIAPHEGQSEEMVYQMKKFARVQSGRILLAILALGLFVATWFANRNF